MFLNIIALKYLFITIKQILLELLQNLLQTELNDFFLAQNLVIIKRAKFKSSDI